MLNYRSTVSREMVFFVHTSNAPKGTNVSSSLTTLYFALAKNTIQKIMNSSYCKQPSLAYSNNGCVDAEVTLKEYALAAKGNVVYQKQYPRLSQLSMEDATNLHDEKHDTMAVIVNNDGIECVLSGNYVEHQLSANAAKVGTCSSISIPERSTESGYSFDYSSDCKSSDDTVRRNNSSTEHAKTFNSNDSDVAICEHTNFRMYKPKHVDTSQPYLMDTPSFDPFGTRSDFSFGEPHEQHVQISNMNEKSALDKIMSQGISSPDKTSSSSSSFEYVLRFCGVTFFDVHEVEDCRFDVE